MEGSKQHRLGTNVPAQSKEESKKRQTKARKLVATNQWVYLHSVGLGSL